MCTVLHHSTPKCNIQNTTYPKQHNIHLQISTNDPFSYILSTADNNLGVVLAKSNAGAADDDYIVNLILTAHLYNADFLLFKSTIKLVICLF